MKHLPARLVVLTSLFAAMPDAAASQEMISRGSVVRVTAPAAGLVDHRGRLDEAPADSIRVDTRLIALSDITEAQVAREVSNFFRFAGVGLLAGVAAGAVTCLNECPSNDSDVSKGGYMLMYTVVAGGGGLALGAFLGALTQRTEWTSVPVSSLGSTLAPAPNGGLQVGFRLPI